MGLKPLTKALTKKTSNKQNSLNKSFFLYILYKLSVKIRILNEFIGTSILNVFFLLLQFRILKIISIVNPKFKKP